MKNNRYASNFTLRPLSPRGAMALAFGCILTSLLASPALASNIAIGSGNWFSGANWTGPDGEGNLIPQVGDGEISSVVGNQNIQISSGTASTDGNLFVGVEGNGRLDVTGGNLNNSQGIITIGAIFIGQNDPATGTFNVSGNAGVTATSLVVGSTANTTGFSTISGGNVTLTEDLSVGLDGEGTLTVTGGTIGVANLFSVGRNVLGKGAFDMSGGTLNITGNLNNGISGDATTNISGGLIDVGEDFIVAQNGTATVNISESAQIKVGADLDVGLSNQGTLSVTGGTTNVAGLFSVGRNSTGTGIFNMSSGTLNIGGDLSNGTLGDATTNISGGLIDVSDDFIVAQNGTAIVNISESAQIEVGDELDVGLSGQGTLSITGGTTNVTGLFSVGRNSSGVGVFNMSSGTLNIGRDLSNATFGLATTNISGGLIDVSDDFVVAQDGTANVDVSGDAQIDIGDELTFGNNSGSTGNLIVRENAVINVNDDIFVGRSTNDSNIKATFILKDNARVNVADDVFHGNIADSQTSITVSDNAVLDIKGRIFIGGTFADNSVTLFTQSDGTVTSENLDIGSIADNARAEFSLSGGLHEGTNSIDMHAGTLDGSGIPNPTTVNISGGELKTGGDIFIADFDDANDINITQTGGKLTVGTDFFFVDAENANATYDFSAGEIVVGGDTVFGADFSDNDSGSFTQSGGAMNITGNLDNTGEVDHTITGGTLDAQNITVGRLGFFNIFEGEQIPDGTGIFNVTDGTVTVRGKLTVENGNTNVLGGRVNVASNLEIANLADSDSTFVLSNGTIRVGGNVILGAVQKDQAIANLNQSGGTLLVGGDIINNRGGVYNFTGGTLSSQNAGPINYSGDLEITAEATIKLDADKTLAITGSFSVLDTTSDDDFAGGGAFSVDGIVLDQAPTAAGSILLVELIGDTDNLLTNNQLDAISLLLLDAGTTTRISEFDFESGNFDSPSWALVEGLGLGGVDGDGQIGIAFSNFVVPEPTGMLLLLIGLCATMLRRVSNFKMGQGNLS